MSAKRPESAPNSDALSMTGTTDEKTLARPPGAGHPGPLPAPSLAKEKEGDAAFTRHSSSDVSSIRHSNHDRHSNDSDKASATSKDSGHHEPRAPGLAPADGEPPSESPEDDTADVPPRYSVYTPWQKRGIVLLGSLAMFFSPLTAQIYLPALPILAEEFRVSADQINLTVTTYMIFQGVTPMFIGGFADTMGRRPAFVICFVIYIAANIGLALSRDYVSVMVVRCLQSAGSSTTVALAQAVVADIVTSAERGEYIGITIIPTVLGPSMGPVIGGLLTQFLGWRSIFWFLTISGSVMLLALLALFPETCRAIVGDGSIRPHPAYRTFLQLATDAVRKRRAKRAAAAAEKAAHPGDDDTGLHRTVSTASSVRPKLKFTAPDVLGSVKLLLEKNLGLLLFYAGVLFAGFYAIATPLPSILGPRYGFDTLHVGLMYLPMAGGSIFAAFVVGPAIDWNFRRHAARAGTPVPKKGGVSARQMDLREFPIERARLEVALPLLAGYVAVTLAWGWALERETSVAVPCVLLFLQGVFLIGTVNTTNALIVDIYPSRAGAAVAANNLTRCLIGAAFSAVVQPMVGKMGLGWTYTFFAALYVVLSPILFLLMSRGVRWRRETREKEERKAKARDDKRRKKQQQEQEREEEARDGET